MFALIASAARAPHITTPGPAASYPVVRMRPAQETHIQVVSGTCEVLAGAASTTLRAGEETTIPPRVAYRLTSPDNARVSQRYRPEA